MAISQLVHTIQQLIIQHEKLLQLANEKREIIINDRVDDLLRITAEESKIVKEISGLEILSRQLLRQAGESLGIPMQESSTLGELLESLPDTDAIHRNQLSGVRTKLLETIDQLKQVNELNRQLIEQSLDYITFQIDILTDAPDQDVTYQRPADDQQVKKRIGLFDRKA